jgi:hypothetical protein
VAEDHILAMGRRNLKTFGFLVPQRNNKSCIWSAKDQGSY